MPKHKFFFPHYRYVKLAKNLTLVVSLTFLCFSSTAQIMFSLCYVLYLCLKHQAGFPLTSKRTFLRLKNMFKTSKIVGVIAVSHEYTSKILGQDVSIRPAFGLHLGVALSPCFIFRISPCTACCCPRLLPFARALRQCRAVPFLWLVRQPGTVFPLLRGTSKTVP